MTIYIETSAAAKLLVDEADALHIAVAVRAAASAMLSYDDRQADAARSAGLRVIAPAAHAPAADA